MIIKLRIHRIVPIIQILINMYRKTCIHIRTLHHLQIIMVRIQQAALIPKHHLQIVVFQIHQAALSTMNHLKIIMT